MWKRATHLLDTHEATVFKVELSDIYRIRDCVAANEFKVYLLQVMFE